MSTLVTANLLKNASFESSATGWRANNLPTAVSFTQYNPGSYGAGYAHDGAGFLEMNASEANASVAQDVTICAQQGESYVFSVWLRAAPGVGSVSGSIVLWGLGGTTEDGGTDFTVGETWTEVTAALDVQNPGHTSLRAEIYMKTTGVNYDVDSALLINAGLQNASFESSAVGWRANNLASAVSFTPYNPGPYGAGYAHDGAGFLEMNSSQTGASIAQDVSVSPLQGQSYSFSVWLRAAPGVGPVSGSVALWGLGGTIESGATSFTVGQTWTQVTAALDVKNTGHTGLRAEIYMNTTGVNYDVDGARLVNAGLQNASFESSAAGWRANNLPTAVSFTQYNPGSYGAGYAHDGAGFLEMNTSQNGASIAQDVPVPAQPGASYSFSVWLRAAPGVGPVSGSVVLWGLGGTTEDSGTKFTVGQAWTQVTATLDVQNGGHQSLRAEIYMNTTGVNYDVDGASLTQLVSLPNVSTAACPGFLPSVNGFHFPNAMSGNYPLVTLPVVGAIASQNANKGVCGGFVFAALDCFLASPRQAIPATTSIPAAGSPLFNYLSSRLVDSLNANGAKDVEWVCLQDHDTGLPPLVTQRGVAWLMITQEWPAIKRDIDAGTPSPMSLIAAPQCSGPNIPCITSALSESHQVLAFAYLTDDANNVTIWVYDCNEPNVDSVTIRFNAGDPTHTTPLTTPGISAGLGGATIRAFFHSTYSAKNPAAIA